MQHLIKRYFWVVGALAVVLCAVFAAKATGAILEAHVLGDPRQAPKIPPAPRRAEVQAQPVRSKDGTAFATRNVFCSECTPPVVSASADPKAIAMTGLPLMLLATNVGATQAASFATVINTDSQRQGAFTLGDQLPGASGPVKEIHHTYVDFENAGRIERLLLQGAAPPPAPTPTAVAATDGADDGRDDLQVAIDSGIKKIDETTYELDKSLVEKALLNPMALIRGARVVPATKGGKPDGFKLYAIRPGSVFAKLGLANGDNLTAVNGFELTTADRALEVYTKLREATSLELEVTRRGKPVTLRYTIR
jgi:general secretion pathway protein C